jgi:hypothetical protein
MKIYTAIQKDPHRFGFIRHAKLANGTAAVAPRPDSAKPRQLIGRLALFSKPLTP